MAIPTARQPVRDALNRPLRDLRISVTDKCNLRCPYCMPAEKYHENYAYLPKERLLSFEEIVRVAGLFTQLGVSKLRLTGGEPLLRRGLPDLVAMLTRVEGVEDLALTTNGVLLSRFARPLRDAGLHRLTVSLDSLNEPVFAAMNGGRASLAPVLEGIAAAVSAGFPPVKINVVVQRGVNERTVVELAESFRGTGHVVRFIEYMDVGTCNGWRREEVVPSKEILARLHARYPLRPIPQNYHGEVAERYAYEDGAGEIGFISSVTSPFCGACSRVRLSPDGAIYTCLFAAQGENVRDLLRDGASDEAILERLRRIWRTRKDRYSELRSTLAKHGAASRRIEMYQIGG